MATKAQKSHVKVSLGSAIRFFLNALDNNNRGMPKNHKMNTWELSYIIHVATWAILCVLALFYQVIAWLPIL